MRIPFPRHVSGDKITQGPDVCPTCNGKGTVLVTVKKECSICDGTGTVLGRPCPKCDGAAPVVEFREEQLCRLCLGLATI